MVIVWNDCELCDRIDTFYLNTYAVFNNIIVTQIFPDASFRVRRTNDKILAKEFAREAHHLQEDSAVYIGSQLAYSYRSQKTTENMIDDYLWIRDREYLVEPLPPTPAYSRFPDFFARRGFYKGRRIPLSRDFGLWDRRKKTKSRCEVVGVYVYDHQDNVPWGPSLDPWKGNWGAPRLVVESEGRFWSVGPRHFSKMQDDNYLSNIQLYCLDSSNGVYQKEAGAV